MSFAIQTESLTKYYGNDLGIKDISLQVNSGEIFGFIGPNGAGKSTFIRTILGLLVPSSGSGKILGRDIVTDGENIRKKIGYLPSEVKYYDEMTSKELLEYHLGFYGINDFSSIDKYADLFELDLHKKITDLSLGNKKKCAVIQAIVHQPELLILDEPTSGLDPLIQNRFFNLLEELNQQGTTVFLSSHILSEVQRLCQRAGVIKNGEIVKIESIDELLKNQTKRIRLLFEERKVEIIPPIGYSNLTWHKTKLQFNFAGDLMELLKWINAQEIIDITIEEPDLETIFMNYYKRNE